MKKAQLLPILLLTVFFACVDEPPTEKYTISTTASPAEGGTVYLSPGWLDSFDEGQKVAIIPQPNEIWAFQKWEGDADGTSNPFFVTMNSNKNITAVFVKRSYPLSINIIGEGTVKEVIVANPSGREYLSGTSVELTPIPNEGWVFESWSGALEGNEIPKRITIDEAKAVSVRFVPKPQGDPRFYLADNGITCKCENVIAGDKGLINGVEYEAVNWDFLTERIRNNMDVSKLCTSMVTEMGHLFYTTSFNQPIGNWDVSNVTNMEGMFAVDQETSGWIPDFVSFNQPIGAWDVSKVTNMDKMFMDNIDFNQDLSGWCVAKIPTVPHNFNTAGTWLLPKPVWGACPD